MAMGDIVLEIVTPRGLQMHERGLDEVVLRRREPDHDPGSEVAILQHHGAELMITCAHVLRYRRGERISQVTVGPGVAEVLDEHVTVLVMGTGPATE
jgi:F0F1-type ATP synthase epsilon subunit